MTLQEAIKSGRHFKRAHWEGYYRSNGMQVVSCDDGAELRPFISDLAADDWEVLEETISFTASQVRTAFRKFLDTRDTIDDFLIALGFKL